MSIKQRPRVRPIFWVLLAATFAIGTGMINYNSLGTPASPTAQPQQTEAVVRQPRATVQQRETAARAIRLAGYDCKTADEVLPYVWSEGFSVWCNHMRYKFEIENHGGRWSVKAP